MDNSFAASQSIQSVPTDTDQTIVKNVKDVGGNILKNGMGQVTITKGIK